MQVGHLIALANGRSLFHVKKISTLLSDLNIRIYETVHIRVEPSMVAIPGSSCTLKGQVVRFRSSDFAQEVFYHMSTIVFLVAA